LASVAAKVREIVLRDPILVECLSRGIVNFSSLARRLAEELRAVDGEEPSVVAVKMALIRIAEKLKGGGIEAVEKVVARSALAVQDSVVVITVPREGIASAFRVASELGGESRFIQVVQSLRSATIVVAREDKDRVLRSIGKPLDVIDDQSVVILVSPREIVETPGVVAYITGFLARHGINITQVISSYVDTLLVMSTGDATRAYGLLHNLIEDLRKKYSAEAAGAG